MRGGASPIDMVEVTAADRAAAPVRVGDEPLRPPTAGTSPFRGGFAGSAPKGSLRRGSCHAQQRMTEDTPLCWGARSRSGKSISSTIRSANGSPPSAEGGEKGINATGMNANLEGLSSVSLSERRCIQSQIEYTGR